MKLLRQPAAVGKCSGYPVFRAWFPWEAAEFTVKKAKTDVAVVQCHKTVPIGKAFEACGVPLVVYLRNVEFHELGGDLSELKSATYIANSQFTARTYREKFGIESIVIPPTINPEEYRTQTSGEYVTFINPYSEKGFERAVEIAKACPDIPFLFVESWVLNEQHRAEVMKAISPLTNVRLESRTNDMKTVYGRTKILLTPSKWEEAWGRVASEAHCSGIPVVGSNRGGLPEAIGDGGVVLDYDAPLDDWTGAIRHLRNDSEAYRRMSDAAFSFSKRPQMNPEKQLSLLTDTIIAASKSGKALAQNSVIEAPGHCIAVQGGNILPT
jgi:glycosyltransferase involved in cell wall biosynthesis